MKKRKDQGEFNFSVFWHNFTRVFSRLFFLPLILGLLLGGYRNYTVQKNYRPIYEMYSVYRIFAGQSGSIDLNSRGHYLDTNAASNLAASYPYLMNSDSTCPTAPRPSARSRRLSSRERPVNRGLQLMAQSITNSTQMPQR